MGTLLKYEFRRSRVIFLGIIGVTLLVELLYLVGWCFKLETTASGNHRRRALSGIRGNGNLALWSYHVQR